MFLYDVQAIVIRFVNIYMVI